MKKLAIHLLKGSIQQNRLIQRIVSWAQLSSLWVTHMFTGCCDIEYAAVSGPRFDWERFGTLPFPALRQCDLLIVFGVVTNKMAPRLKRVYEQMPEPKYVMAIGACSITGGLFKDSYNVVKGVDKLIPVDVYVPGCPPRPEAFIQGLRLLQEKIRSKKR